MAQTLIIEYLVSTRDSQLRGSSRHIHGRVDVTFSTSTHLSGLSLPPGILLLPNTLGALIIQNLLLKCFLEHFVPRIPNFLGCHVEFLIAIIKHWLDWSFLSFYFFSFLASFISLQ